MAEFLIYNKEHWMDVDNAYAVWRKKIEDNPIFTVAERARNLVKFDRKHDARYQRGDIVEIRPDGYWSIEKHFDAKMFALLKVPGLSFEDAESYMERWHRDVSVTQTLNNAINYIYEYSCVLNRVSTLEEELFKSEEFTSLDIMADVTMLSHNNLQATVRLEPLNNPKVKLFEDIIILPIEEQAEYVTPEYRHEEFDVKGEIAAFQTMLRKRKYNISNDFSIVKEQSATSIANANITTKII